MPFPSRPLFLTLALCTASLSLALPLRADHPLQEHKDYENVGKDLPADCLDSDIIRLYEINDHNGEGRNLTFADSHTEFVKTADMPKTLNACNAARARLHLKPITIPVIEVAPPAAPPATPPATEPEKESWQES